MTDKEIQMEEMMANMNAAGMGMFNCDFVVVYCILYWHFIVYLISILYEVYFHVFTFYTISTIGGMQMYDRDSMVDRMMEEYGLDEDEEGMSDMASMMGGMGGEADGGGDEF